MTQERSRSFVRFSTLVPTLVMALASACGPPATTPEPKPTPSLTKPAWTHELVTRALAAGADSPREIITGFASEGDRVGEFIESAPAPKCLLVVAAGSEGIADLDVSLFGDDGTLHAADETSTATAAVLFCAALPKRLYASARVASGVGGVALIALEVPPSKLTNVAQAAGARDVLSGTGRLDGWPGLEEKLATHRALVGSRFADLRRLALPLDPSSFTRTSFAIEARRCLDVFVTPSDDVAAVDVSVETDDGRVVARADNEGRDRSFVLCSEVTRNVTLAMRPRVSPGLAAVVVGQASEGARLELERAIVVTNLTQTLSVAEARREHQTRVSSAWSPVSLSVAGEAKVGARTSVSLPMTAGCARIDVVTGAPLGAILGSVWDAKGFLRTSLAGDTVATGFSCGDANESLTVDVEAASRPGPFAVEARRMKIAVPVLMNTRIAAGRLLGRLAAAGFDDPSRLAPITRVELAEEQRVSQDVTVPANTCVDIVVALDRGGAGVRLRVTEGGNEISATRAKDVVGDRFCAAEQPRSLVLALSLRSGSAPALVVAQPVQTNGSTAKPR